MIRFHHPFGPQVFHEGWHGVLWWLVPLVFVIMAAGLVVWVVTRLTGRRQQTPVAMWGPGSPGRYVDSARDHVRLRYARGEISREEFFQLSADLGGSPPDRPAGGDPPGGAGSA